MKPLGHATSRRIGSRLVVVVLTLCGLALPAAAADQVSFSAVSTAVITSVTNLPGGLIRLDGNITGSATHLGNIGGPITRIQDHQGNFSSTTVLVSANGKDGVSLTVSGRFEKGGQGSCGVFTSTGTYTVTGGTGSFANATGGGSISTEIDECAGTAAGTYVGTISRPNSG